MKIFLLALAVSISPFLSAQFTYTLRIKNLRNAPMPGVVVTAENAAKNIVLKETTDAEGKAVFKLEVVGTYVFSFLEMKNVATAEVEEGYYGTFSRTVAYDPKGELAEKPRMNRTGIEFKKVPALALKGQKFHAKVNLTVKELKSSPVPNVEVALVSEKDKTKYFARTNALGLAIFYVPSGQTYEIDVAQLEGLDMLPVEYFEMLEMTKVVHYEKAKVLESVKGDTIYQNSIANTKGSTTHNLFTLQLNNFDGNPLPDEPVYLKAMNSKRVYAGTTNAKGSCSFLLEKGDDYILNLKYESNLIVVEVPVTRGFGTESATRRYRGSKEIERILAEQKAEMERLAEQARLEALKPKPGDKDYPISFRETPVRPIAKAPDNYLTKTADGYNVDFDNAGPAGTPTVIGDAMYSQAGMYSSDYYCLNATSGQFIWGLELGESGISPAVYHKGILLINTASCSLYAIEALTGKLLWSKWLSGYVYSTPSADDNSVYVVYKHGDVPVLVSFDLRSGKLNWLERVDEEAIACPVVAGNEIHVASQKGLYHVFDKATGKNLKTITTYKMVSSPTISGDKIFITAEIAGQDQLIVLNRKTLELEKKYPTKMKSMRISGERNVDETNQMNFNGSHPVVYKNEIVLVLDASKIMAFDMASEKMLWQQSLATHSDQLPIISNGKVFVTSKTGEVMSYDMKTGEPKLIKKVSGNMEGQPIARNGILYIAAGGIISMIKTAQKFDWHQWNKDAGHNTVFD